MRPLVIERASARSARRNYTSHPAPYHREQSSDSLVDQVAERNSRALLVAQLRAGQHSLGADRFWETVRDLRARGHM